MSSAERRLLTALFPGDHLAELSRLRDLARTGLTQRRMGEDVKAFFRDGHLHIVRKRGRRRQTRH
jgi:hypothetical protein